MSKSGWDGIQVLDENPMQLRDDTIAIDKSFARTFDTEEGKRVLKYLIAKRYINQLGYQVAILALVLRERANSIAK